MKSHIKTVVGIGLSLLLLGWVLRDVSPAEVARELGEANLLLLVLAVALTMAGFAIRAVRWGVLLSPLGHRIPFRPRFAAVMIGFAVNNLLPARIGEFARALSLARVTPVATAAAFATLVVERILDGLVLVALLFVAMSTTEFPLMGNVAGIDPRAAARVVAAAMAVVGVCLLVLVIAPSRSVAVAEAAATRVLPAGVRRPVIAALESFLAGLAVLRSGRLFSLSAFLALGQWLFTALSFLVAFRAFGIYEVPFAGAIFLQSLISLAVAIPSSPGFFGPFEAAAKLGLALWEVGSDKAVSFAVGFHLGGFVPVTVIGLYYMYRLKLSWREVRESEESVEETVEQAAGTGVEAALRERQ